MRCAAHLFIASSFGMLLLGLAIPSRASDYIGPPPPAVVALDINLPDEGLHLMVGESFQVKVIARFDDGSQQDVTTDVHYSVGLLTFAGEPTNEVVSVSDTGEIQALAVGDDALLISFTQITLRFALLDVKIREPGDRDGDGLPDEYEVSFGLDPDFGRDGEFDTDGDLLENVEEFELKTDPLLRDTDGDGDSDGLEVERGTDPLTPEPPPDPGLRLDERCIVAALNRTVPVDPDGTWILPRIPANVGPVRIRTSCVAADGSVFSGQSEPVAIPADGVVRAPEIVFEQPRPVPVSLSVTSPQTVLTQDGELVQLTTTAIFPDSSTADVTSASQGTGYSVSNPAVLSVSGEGGLTALASGVALVTAVNEGALGFLQIEVRLGGDSDGDGVPDEVELELGLDPNNPFDVFGDLDGDGLTDREELVELGTDPLLPDTDGDGIEDGEEVASGTDGFVTLPLAPDTDGDGLGDGLEVATGSDPTDPASFNLAAALEALELSPQVFSLTFSTIGGEASRQLSVTGLLIDGTEIDLTSRSRGTVYSSSDLSVCNFGLEDGLVFAGAEGTCTLGVDNAGFRAEATATVRAFEPGLVTSLELPGFARDVAVSGDFVWVAADFGGVVGVSVADRELPSVVSQLSTPGEARDVRLHGDLALVADGSAGLSVVDVGEPASPALVASLDTPGNAQALVVRGEQLLVADGPEGLRVIDIAEPLNPVEVGALPLPGVAQGVDATADGAFAAVACGAAGLQLVDLSDPTAPQLLSTLPSGDARDGALISPIAGLGRVALVADREEGLITADLTEPSAPVRLAVVPREVGGLPVDLATRTDSELGELAFAADVLFINAAPIYDVADPATPSVRALLDFSEIDKQPGRGIAADTDHLYLVAGDSASSRLYIARYRALEDRGEVPPVVRVAAPEEGASIGEGEVFVLEVVAADDVGVLEVDITVDGEVVLTDGAAPFRAELTAPQAPAELILGAVARDFAGNEGVAEPVTVRVVGAAATTVVGSVVRGDDATQVPGARVFTDRGGEGVTDEAGRFSVPGVPAFDGLLRVFASADLGGERLRGVSPPVLPVPEGVTDVGAVSVEPLGDLYPGVRSVVELTAAGFARDLIRADLDRDGRADLVALFDQFGASDVVVLQSLGGSRFEQTSTVRVPRPPRTADAGDVDGDGHTDLVVGTTDGLYLAGGAGHGSFGAATQEVAGRTEEVRVGDLDGDGRADVAARRLDSSGNPIVEVYRSTSAGLVPTAALPGHSRVFPLADFNGDDRLDLLTQGPTGLVVLLGNGDVTFGPERPLGVGGEDAVSADFDGDGRADVAYATFFRGVAILLGNSDGTFRSFHATSAADTLFRLRVADLDADRSPDLVGSATGSQALHLHPFRNRGDGTLERLDLVAVGQRAQRFRLVEADGDGGPVDAVALDDSGVAVFRGRGDGGFDSFRRLEPFVRPVVTRLADLDRDGELDIVFIEQRDFSTGVKVKLGTGGGEFAEVASFSDGQVFTSNLAALEILDVDADGFLDAITLGSPGTVRLLPGRGDGTFDEVRAVETGLRVQAIDLADLDGDGLPDLVAVAGDELLVLTNRGDGAFAPPVTLPLPTFGRAVRLADANGDEHTDAFVLVGDGSIELLLNSGTTLHGFGQVAGASRGREIEVADLDRDRRTDLLRLHQATRFDRPAEVEVLRATGDGGFESVGRFPVANGSRGLTVGDLDRDGRLDVALADPQDAVGVLLSDATGVFSTAQSFAADPDPWSLAVGDVDGDGRPEIVVGATSNTDSSSRTLIVLPGL